MGVSGGVSTGVVVGAGVGEALVEASTEGDETGDVATGGSASRTVGDGQGVGETRVGRGVAPRQAASRKRKASRIGLCNERNVE